MGSLKRSSFPAVLKQYLPDYEPSFAVESAPKRSEGSPQVAGCRCQSDTEQKTRVTGSSSERQPTARKSSKSPAPTLTRENTNLQAKRQELKRYRQNYENWQAAKADLKEESGRNLRARIIIQQDLIRQQAELSARRQKELFHTVIERREAAKEVKQAKEEALQQVCRQSLEDDRQKAADDRRSQREASKHGGSKDSLVSTSSSLPPGPPHGRTGGTLLPPGPLPGGEGPTLRATFRRQPQPGPVHRRTSHHGFTQEAMVSQPSMVAEEAEDEVEQEEGTQEQLNPGEEQVDGLEDEPIPWHAEQLYKLYGKQADYFLKPRPEEKERKKTVTILNPKLRLRGRAGAGSLWNSLRDDSQTKLLHQDMSISPELKAAYSAFVRQCLSHRKKPVKRNFYAEEDVPEMDRLLDNSRILSAHDYKHMVEVMFRSSTMNQDKTGVLLYNNPPPNLNNWSGNESCGRYMPSWIPDYDDEEDEPDYRKWIKTKSTKPESEHPLSASMSEQGQGDADLKSKMAGVSMSMDAASLDGNQRDNQWDFLKKMKPKRQKVKAPKYMFLTEKEATCEGQFSRKRKELLESRHIPQAFAEKGPKPQSALAMAGDNSTRRGSDFSESPGSVTRSQSQMSRQQFTSNWQPLSLEALVEYKEAVTVMGEGDFQHGTVPRWSVDMVEKAH